MNDNWFDGVGALYLMGYANSYGYGKILFLDFLEVVSNRRIYLLPLRSFRCFFAARIFCPFPPFAAKKKRERSLRVRLNFPLILALFPWKTSWALSSLTFFFFAVLSPDFGDVVGSYSDFGWPSSGQVVFPYTRGLKSFFVSHKSWKGTTAKREINSWRIEN